MSDVKPTAGTPPAGPSGGDVNPLTWPRPAQLTLGGLLLLGILGWSIAIGRGGRLGDAEERNRSLDAQVAQLNGSLTHFTEDGSKPSCLATAYATADS